jgi:hypothetical protein
LSVAPLAEASNTSELWSKTMPLDGRCTRRSQSYAGFTDVNHRDTEHTEVSLGKENSVFSVPLWLTYVGNEKRGA